MSYEILYDKFVEEINNFSIKSINFSITDFSHYDNCTIETKIDVLDNSNKIFLIVVNLTQDDSEKISFLNKFNETYKLFRMGRKGSFSLKQIWGRINIKTITYS